MLVKPFATWRVILTFALICLSVQATADELDDAIVFWEAHAPVCESRSGFVFPAKANCEDGDMTLFNGLLCAANVPVGCEAVKRAMDASGRWHRSPRLAEQPELRPTNSFSPDMALGAQLYLLKTGDLTTAAQWIAWLQDSPACWIEGDPCFRNPFPRFCTNDDEKGCTIRPGDASMLARTFAALEIDIPADTTLGAYLRTMRGDVTVELDLSAMLNDPGYPRHLSATGILMTRLGGATEPEELRLAIAARVLSGKDPENPFFAWLAGATPDVVKNMLLETCPTETSELPDRLDEWSWEIERSSEKYGRHMLWDCIFVGHLLRASAP